MDTAVTIRSKYIEGFRYQDDFRIQLLLTALLIGVAYYVGALLSFTLRVPSTRSSIIWIPNAILLAAFVVTPVKRWWLWILAALPAHILAQSRDAAPILVLLCPFVANVAQAALAAVGLRLLTEVPHRLESLRNMAVFILVAVIGVPAVVSFTAAWLFVLAGWETDYWLVGQARLLNNVVTGLTVAPLCLAIAGGNLNKLRCLQFRRYVEFAVVIVGLVLVLSAASAWQAAETIDFPIRLYAPLPFLLWAAVRFGPPGLAISLLAVAYDSISDSIVGPASIASSPAVDVLALETSLGVLSLPLMLLAALMQERQHKDEALCESQERLARTEKFSLVMVTHTDLDGRWLKVPPTLCELLGYTEQELLGRRFDELTHPDDVEINLSRRLQLLRDEIKSFDLEKRYVRKDGRIVWVYINVSVVLDTNGTPVHFLSYIRDISRRKQAEQGLRESEERLQLALEAGGMGVWDWDTCSNALQWSSEHFTIMGLKPFSVTPTYQTWAERMHPDDRPSVSAAIARAIAESSHYRAEYRIVLPDGSQRWVISRGEAVYKTGGEFVRLTGVTVDITNRKRAESRLNVQYQITRVLSSSASLADAAPALIQTMCKCFDWHCGEIWQVSSRAQVLTYLEGWHSASMPLAEFVSESRRFTFSPGIGLPGRVWKSGAPAWINNLADDDDFPRAHLADKFRLKSAFSLPVTLSNQTLAVLTFFSPKLREPDEELLQAMDSIGHQIGQFIERKKAEHLTSQRDQLLHTMFESLSFHVVVLNRDGTITYASKLREQLSVDQPLLNHLAVGTNYLDVCRRAASLNDNNAKEALYGIENVLTGKFPSFSMEYPCDAVEGRRWFAVQIDPMPRDHGGLIISHADITERKQADEALRNALNEVRKLKEQLEVENIYLREEVSGVHRFGGIGGRSDAIAKALRHAELVAPTDATVLITGETGTGKELLALAVHARSKRSQRPLIKVNCAGLPASLIESELFGHEKGAFTGAGTKRIGRFELANEATIFLDEVGELPLELQTKLLRVVQEGEFERLGSSKTIKVSTRVIAATNRDLGLAVKSGTFRDDLYYRLNVYPIKLPPLRDRKEDIPELVQTFLREANRRLGRTFKGVSQRVMEGFMKYDWPGNVRELQNVIERMAVTAKGTQLSLPSDWLSGSLTDMPHDLFNSQPAQSTVASEEETTVENVERAHILRILEQRHWRIEGPHGAAVVLGLKPSTLRSRMRRLRIDRLFQADKYH
jgi:PAS domain S-box-containing protein